jgi:putative protease
MFGSRVENENTQEYIELCKNTRMLYREGTERQNIDIKFGFKALKGVPALLKAVDCDNNIVTIQGQIPQTSISKPLETGAVKQQLEKTGSTQYFVKSMEIEVENGISLPLSAVNAMRRDAISKLDDLRVLRPKEILLCRFYMKNRKIFQGIRIFVYQLTKLISLTIIY